MNDFPVAFKVSWIESYPYNCWNKTVCRLVIYLIDKYSRNNSKLWTTEW